MLDQQKAGQGILQFGRVMVGPGSDEEKGVQRIAFRGLLLAFPLRFWERFTCPVGFNPIFYPRSIYVGKVVVPEAIFKGRCVGLERGRKSGVAGRPIESKGLRHHKEPPFGASCPKPTEGGFGSGGKIWILPGVCGRNVLLMGSSAATTPSAPY